MTDDPIADNGQLSDDAQWFPVSKAAPLLGLKERTLRRRIADGAFQTRQTPLGVLVHVAAEAGHGGWPRPVETDRGQSRAPNSANGSILPTVDIATHAISEMRTVAEQMRVLVERERARSAELEERLRQAEQAAAIHQERSRNLEEENKRLHAQLALPEPSAEPTSPPDPVEVLRVQVEQLQARLGAPQPPRWQFWRRQG